MTARVRNDLQVVEVDLQRAEIDIAEAVKQTGPMVQRLSTHRERIVLAVKELESERFAMLSRRDHLRRQFNAVDGSLGDHLQDIRATLALYACGLNSLEIDAD